MMNQVFHYVCQHGEKHTRIPWQGRGVEKYSSKEMFGEHEKRQFLEVLGPFAMASFDNNALGEAQSVLKHGFPYDGTTWYVAGGYIRDDGVVYTLLPEGLADEAFFTRLGLSVELNKQQEAYKVGKYLKRLWSNHHEYLEGTVIRRFAKGRVLLVRLNNGKMLSVRYAEGGPLVDGMNLVSTHCLRMLGHRGSQGTGLRITALSEQGFSKGHAIVLDNLVFDLVLFDSKPLLKAKGDKFVLAIDELHPGELATDSQSIINYRMYEIPHLREWSFTFMNTVIDAVEDEEKLRGMLRFYTEDFHQDKDGDFIEKEKDWGLLRAMRAGVKITSHPGLMRKVAFLFKDQVWDCEKRMRIPVPKTTGDARYILVDPTIFDENGNPTKEGVLRGNEVWYPGHVGPVVFHRQPNAHRSEHIIAGSVSNNKLAEMDTEAFMFMSRDSIIPTMQRLGGGDQDDRVVVYTDQRVVDHMKSLPPYPEVAKDVRLEIKRKDNVFDFRLPRLKPVYTRFILGIMLEQQLQSHTTIGQAVNPLMDDSLTTDQMDVIIRDIESRPVTDKHTNTLNWCRLYKGNVLAPLASGLEDIIDAVKKDGTDTSEYANMIRKYWDEKQVIARCMLRGGLDNRGRLPDRRRKPESHPVIVETMLDVELDAINDLREQLEHHIIDLSWKMLEEVPEEILTYPTEDESVQLAKDMRAFYKAQLDEHIRTLDGTQEKERKAAFKLVDFNTYERFKEHPLIIDAMVNIYIAIYRRRQMDTPLDAEGNPKPFADGILWGAYMSALTIKMMDKCELTVRYEPAELYKKHYKHEVMDVRVDNGIITVQGTDIVIGMCNPVLDGPDRRLERGLMKMPARDAIAYEPRPKITVLTVVNGWKERIDAGTATYKELNDWFVALLHTKVSLEPTTFDDEHAVKVFSKGVHVGWLDKKEAMEVVRPREGWLAPKKGATFTMSVIIAK